MMENGTMLSVREAAKMLGVHENTLRRWADEGMLPVYRYGMRKDRRVKRADLEKFLEHHRQRT